MMVQTSVNITSSTSLIKYVIRFLLNSPLTRFLLNSLFNFNSKRRDHTNQVSSKGVKGKKMYKNKQTFGWISWLNSIFNFDSERRIL